MVYPKFSWRTSVRLSHGVGQVAGSLHSHVYKLVVGFGCWLEVTRMMMQDGAQNAIYSYTRKSGISNVVFAVCGTCQSIFVSMYFKKWEKEEKHGRMNEERAILSACCHIYGILDCVFAINLDVWHNLLKFVSSNKLFNNKWRFT